MALQARFTADLLEAGLDEAGRGCLAGPVIAAAVILPNNYHLPGLADSKTLSELERDRLAEAIKIQALAWAVGVHEAAVIDQLNILWAAVDAMQQAVLQLAVRPDLLLVDGNRFKPMPGYLHACQIKGDGRYASIAAASILAKTHRDAIMTKLHQQYPWYGWDTNRGYPTPPHRRAIAQFGATVHHRLTFSWQKEDED